MCKIEGLKVLDFLKERSSDLFSIVKNTTKNGRNFMDKEYQDCLCCEIINDTEIVVSNSHPLARPSQICVNLNDRIVVANSGCTGKRGAPNMFLDEGLPNYTYKIDGNMEFKTDDRGRTILAMRFYDKKPPKKYSLNDDRRNVLRCIKQLKQEQDAGHLLQRTLGGINECINLLPMQKAWQRYGIWRKLERLEEGIVEIEKHNDCKIISTRRLFYDYKGKLPHSIEFDVQVNGMACINYTVSYQT